MGQEIIRKIEEVTDNFDGFRITTNKQVIEFGIGNNSSCCEQWGHLASDDNIRQFEGVFLLGIRIVGEGYNPEEIVVSDWSGNAKFVNVDTDMGTLQFAVYNVHNGYYGHIAFIKSMQIQEEWIL